MLLHGALQTKLKIKYSPVKLEITLRNNHPLDYLLRLVLDEFSSQRNFNNSKFCRCIVVLEHSKEKQILLSAANTAIGEI